MRIPNQLKRYFNFYFIPFYVLVLFILHEAYINFPRPDQRPPFTIGQTTLGVGGDLVAILSVESDGGKLGDEFAVKLTLRNHGDSDYVQRMKLPLFDVYVYNENSSLVATWSDGRDFVNNIFLIVIEPGGEFSDIKVWELSVHNLSNDEMAPLKLGNYWISGVWLGEPRIETNKISLKIG